MAQELRVLALSLVFVLAAAPAVTSTSPRFDARATADALAIRMGHRVDTWTIDIADHRMGRKAVVTLRSERGETLKRNFVVSGTTTEDRSRELAAALALVLEQHLASAATPPKPPTQPEGWIAVGARVGVGRPTDVDAGLSLRGGALWGRRILQPIGSVAWSRSRERGLTLDGVRFGAGVAVGTDLPGTPLWLGGAIVPHVLWTLARHTARDRGWSSATELSALLQVRSRWFFGGLRVGVEITEPPLRARGTDAALRWGHVRLLVGLELGVRLPPR